LILSPADCILDQACKQRAVSDCTSISGGRIFGLDTQENRFMNKQFIARASITIDAPIAKVWNALINPELIKQYMFGTNVVSEWREGGSIVWKGEWQGKAYEDKGVILRLEPERKFQYSHFSPLSGLPDKPENYHTVTIELSTEGTATLVSLSQDNNQTEQEREHSEKNWTMMLNSLKKLLEK
jgi:uncharacterized protein YndB with AHSA1/START domain